MDRSKWLTGSTHPVAIAGLQIHAGQQGRAHPEHHELDCAGGIPVNQRERKLSSRKLWVSFIGFLALLLTALGLPDMAISKTVTADLLSQWRGYANDGNGVAIGFFEPILHKFLGTNNDPSAKPGVFHMRAKP